VLFGLLVILGLRSCVLFGSLLAAAEGRRFVLPVSCGLGMLSCDLVGLKLGCVRFEVLALEERRLVSSVVCVMRGVVMFPYGALCRVGFSGTSLMICSSRVSLRVLAAFENMRLRRGGLCL